VNSPLRAGKGSAYEGGVRVPLMIRWPGHTRAASSCDTPVIGIDLYPTVLEMTGASRARGQVIDGESLARLCQGDRGLRRDAIFWHYPHYHAGGATPYSAIRQGPWRLVQFQEDGRVELYNLAQDISETADLARREPDRANRMKQRLENWRRDVGAQMADGNPGLRSRQSARGPVARRRGVGRLRPVQRTQARQFDSDAGAAARSDGCDRGATVGRPKTVSRPDSGIALDDRPVLSLVDAGIRSFVAGNVGARAVGIEFRAGRVRLPRSAHRRGAVVDLGPDHDARFTVAARRLHLGERVASPACSAAVALLARFELFLAGARGRACRRDRRAARARPGPAFCAGAAPSSIAGTRFTQFAHRRGCFSPSARLRRLAVAVAHVPRGEPSRSSLVSRGRACRRDREARAGTLKSRVPRCVCA